jgi:hypothetical protein
MSAGHCQDAIASRQCCCCGVVTELVLMLLCSCCPSACLCVSWLSLPPARIGTHSWACTAASLNQALDNAGVDLQQHNMQQVTFDFCLVSRHALLSPSWTHTANHHKPLIATFYIQKHLTPAQDTWQDADPKCRTVSTPP